MQPAANSLPDVAKTGDRLATLRTLRDILAQEIVTCDSKRDLAALSRQFTDVLAAIENAGGKQTMEDRVFDELSARRSDRGANPGDSVDTRSG